VESASYAVRNLGESVDKYLPGVKKPSSDCQSKVESALHDLAAK
jgi:hypothetical protein